MFSMSATSDFTSSNWSRSALFTLRYNAFATDVLLAFCCRLSFTSSVLALVSIKADNELRSF